MPHAIEMKDGKLGVARKYRGKILDVKKKYIEDELSAHKDDADLSRIFLTSSSASDAEVKEFTALIKSILPFKEVLIGLHHRKPLRTRMHGNTFHD